MRVAMTKVKPQIPLQVFLSPDEHAKLRAIAGEQNRSMSGQIRAWIAQASAIEIQEVAA